MRSRTYPGVQIGAFPAELREQVRKMDEMLRHLSGAASRGIPHVPTDPTNPTNGDMWYNTTSGTLKTFVNGAVKAITLT